MLRAVGCVARLRKGRSPQVSNNHFWMADTCLSISRHFQQSTISRSASKDASEEGVRSRRPHMPTQRSAVRLHIPLPPVLLGQNHERIGGWQEAFNALDRQDRLQDVRDDVKDGQDLPPDELQKTLKHRITARAVTLNIPLPAGARDQASTTAKQEPEDWQEAVQKAFPENPSQRGAPLSIFDLGNILLFPNEKDSRGDVNSETLGHQLLTSATRTDAPQPWQLFLRNLEKAFPEFTMRPFPGLLPPNSIAESIVPVIETLLARREQANTLADCRSQDRQYVRPRELEALFKEKTVMKEKRWFRTIARRQNWRERNCQSALRLVTREVREEKVDAEQASLESDTTSHPHVKLAQEMTPDILIEPYPIESHENETFPDSEVCKEMRREMEEELSSLQEYERLDYDEQHSNSFSHEHSLETALPKASERVGDNTNSEGTEQRIQQTPNPLHRETEEDLGLKPMSKTIRQPLKRRERTFFRTLSNFRPSNELPLHVKDQLMLSSRVHSDLKIVDIGWLQYARALLCENINQPDTDLGAVLLSYASLTSLYGDFMRDGQKDWQLLAERMQRAGWNVYTWRNISSADKSRHSTIASLKRDVAKMGEQELVVLVEHSNAKELIALWPAIKLALRKDSHVWSSLLHRAASLKLESEHTYFWANDAPTPLLQMCKNVVHAVGKSEEQEIVLFDPLTRILWCWINEWASSWKLNDSTIVPGLASFLWPLSKKYTNVLLETLLMKIVTPSPWHPDNTRERWETILPEHLMHALISLVSEIQDIPHTSNTHLRGLKSRLEDIIASRGCAMTVTYLKGKSDIEVVSFFLRTWVRYRGWRYTRNEQAAFCAVDNIMDLIISKIKRRAEIQDFEAHPGLLYAQAILSLMKLEIPERYFVSDIVAMLLNSGRKKELLSMLSILAKSSMKPNITGKSFITIIKFLTPTHPDVALAILCSRPARSVYSFSYYIRYWASTSPQHAMKAFDAFVSVPPGRLYGGRPDATLLVAMARQFANSNALTPRQAYHWVDKCWKTMLERRYPADIRMGEAIVWAVVVRYLFDANKPGQDFVVRHPRIKWAFATLQHMAAIQDLQHTRSRNLNWSGSRRVFPRDPREIFDKRDRADEFLVKVRGLMHKYLDRKKVIPSRESDAEYRDSK